MGRSNSVDSSVLLSVSVAAVPARTSGMSQFPSSSLTMGACAAVTIGRVGGRCPGTVVTASPGVSDPSFDAVAPLPLADANAGVAAINNTPTPTTAKNACRQRRAAFIRFGGLGCRALEGMSGVVEGKFTTDVLFSSAGIGSA